MKNTDSRRVLVLVNPKSGLPRSFTLIRRALDEYWDVEGVELYYQFSQSKQDSIDKTHWAVDRGADTILVVGGDGTISTVGRALIDTDVALGAIPSGSGNGFARHFGLSLSPDIAIKALASAAAAPIDVGVVNGLPFLVPCSLAWDASLVKSFDKLPVRGILPYVFAGVQEFLQYRPQAMTVTVDESEEISFPDPVLFTVANLTEYGGGAKIAPHAVHDDGKLELIAARHQDVPLLIVNAARFFDGTIQKIPNLLLRSFSKLSVKRKEGTPIQVDGELVDAPPEVTVEARAKALRVLVPQ